MAKAVSYYQRGESIDYVNTTDDLIEALEVITIGSHVGIAACPIFPGQTGTLAVQGVFALPKGSDEIEAGADIAWDGETASAAEEGAIGYAVEAAAADDDSVKVKLLG